MYIAMEERKPIKVQNSKLSTTNHIIELLVNLDQNPNTKSIVKEYDVDWETVVKDCVEFLIECDQKNVIDINWRSLV